MCLIFPGVWPQARPSKRRRHRFEKRSSFTWKECGEIAPVETFAAGTAIREIARLRKFYGKERWRKRKGMARIRLDDGSIHLAEIHWFEATGTGKGEMKVKRLVEGF
jgi:hypothetical protein